MTPKQKEFARLYAVSQSAQAAALGAGYSKQYAKSNSGKLLLHEEVVAEIQRLRQRMNARAEKSATDVVNEYSKIAFTDRYEFLKPDPDFPGQYIFKHPDELTPDQRAVCIEITPKWEKRKRMVNGVGEVEVHREEWCYRFADKENALQQMGRHFGIFDDKLKLVAGHSNPFKNASPQQLAELKESFIKTMSNQHAPAISAPFKEVDK